MGMRIVQMRLILDFWGEINEGEGNVDDVGDEYLTPPISHELGSLWKVIPWEYRNKKES